MRNEDETARVLTALVPLVELLGPSATRILPSVVRDVTGSESSAIAILGGAERGVETILHAEGGSAAGSAAAGELLHAMATRPDDEEVVVQRLEGPGGGTWDALAAGLRHGTERSGFVCAMTTAGGFTSHDRAAFASLVPILGPLVATSGREPEPPREGEAPERLRHEIEAAERERQRWARNLHDETLQSLAVLRFSLAAALDAPRAGDRRAMARAIEGLGEQIEGLRGLINDLRPSVLDQLGLGPALVALVERNRGLTGARIDLRLALGADEDRLPDDLELTVYRLVQEALNNVVKHAHATTVRVAIARREDRLELLVADDGVGFDSSVPTRGAGLIGMAERVALARGRMEIRSRPDVGTTVEVDVPV